MMTNEEIFEGLKTILSTVNPSLKLDNITSDSKLFSELGLDSLTMMLLSIAIETRFSISFDGTPKFETVGDVIGYIAERVK